MNTLEDILHELIVMRTNAFDQHDVNFDDIVRRLENEANQKFGSDVEQWVSWYLKNTNEEKTAFIKDAYGIYKARMNFENKRSSRQ